LNTSCISATGAFVMVMWFFVNLARDRRARALPYSDLECAISPPLFVATFSVLLTTSIIAIVWRSLIPTVLIPPALAALASLFSLRAYVVRLRDRHRGSRHLPPGLSPRMGRWWEFWAG
jgi:hypothetical protein